MMKKLLFTFLFLLISFSNQAQSIGIVGDFNGWGSDVVMTTSDNENYSVSGYTFGLTGGVKFRQDGAWAVNWGSNSFPTGTGTSGGPNIPVPAGTYDIAFNRTTGAYSFTAVSAGFDNIGFIGLFNEWTESVAMITTNGIEYSMPNYYFGANNVKFRKDNSWEVNWGGDTFPGGTATLNGSDIPLTIGFYNVNFNKNTLVYNFDQVPVSILGTGALGWDTDIQMNSTDGGINFTLNNLTLVDGVVKFRANNSWATNWGSDTFPVGTGVADGIDIPTVAGTYNVSFNRLTGEYNFATLSVVDFTTSKAKVYPNPSQNVWNFSIENDSIEKIQIVDVTGKVIVDKLISSNLATIDATALTSGIYFAKVKTNYAIQTIKLVRK
ncbi:MAG: hypothetical protein C0512_09150 [Flavobacterium sp.]|nr:hypothetical protein [Flavobacterium sp.]